MTIREFIAKQRWIFAKTYAAFAPHEYIIKGKCNATDDEFEAFARAIVNHGIRMFYYKNERKYLLIDGYFYWIMTDEVDEKTNIINRCMPEDYDIVFVRKGTWLNSKKAKEENTQLELKLD